MKLQTRLNSYLMCLNEKSLEPYISFEHMCRPLTLCLWGANDTILKQVIIGNCNQLIAPIPIEVLTPHAPFDKPDYLIKYIKHIQRIPNEVLCLDMQSLAPGQGLQILYTGKLYTALVIVSELHPRKRMPRNKKYK